jgi:hypothetical protein
MLFSKKSLICSVVMLGLATVTHAGNEVFSFGSCALQNNYITLSCDNASSLRTNGSEKQAYFYDAIQQLAKGQTVLNCHLTVDGFAQGGPFGMQKATVDGGTVTLDLSTPNKVSIVNPAFKNVSGLIGDDGESVTGTFTVKADNFIYYKDSTCPF